MKRALIIYPEFPSCSFWNYKDVCKLVGAKYPTAPLGLITLAALLPLDWSIKLVDLNTTELYDSEIDWADLVFIGGMLPQQINFLNLIDRVHARGKKVVAGAHDPTSQPEIYQKADYLVLGEAEDTIVSFLADLEMGVEGGTYLPSEDRPDITKSPTPRFDLLNFKDYLSVGIQFSRGCPYNCEFCDIIELYGRRPRTKTPKQIVKELDTLYNCGYRGHVDFVDDNFIGHKKKVKEILKAVKIWSEENGYPFFFSTEASINLADDGHLLELMQEVDFRYVFIGIENANEEVLIANNKMININRNLNNDIHKIYSYGIVVNAGFIIGFDNETSKIARSIVDTVRECKVCMSMIGLLYALPNTQLTQRLIKEDRLFKNSSMLADDQKHEADQATSGLNFITKRSRSEILNDFIYILKSVYSRRNYFNRCLRLGKVLKTKKRKHRFSFGKKLKIARGFFRLAVKLGIKPPTAYYFWKNILTLTFTHPSSLAEIVNLMAMYVHFQKQTKFVVSLMNQKLDEMKRTERKVEVFEK